MTKAELVREVSLRTGLDRKEVLDIVEAFMVSVKDALASGQEVNLRGFGSFLVKQRAAKTARNISRGTTLVVPAHGIPVLKPAKEFLGMVRGV